MCELVSFNASKDINNLRYEMNERMDLIQQQLDSLLVEREGAPQRGGGRVDPPKEGAPSLASSTCQWIDASLGKSN